MKQHREGSREDPSSPTSPPEEQNEEKQPVLRSVQLKLPTEVVNLPSLAQVADSQARLRFGNLGQAPGIYVASLDPRIKYVTFIPLSAVKGVRLEYPNETR